MNNLLKIVNYLARNFPQEFTLHQLSKLCKIPYATFYRTIKNNEGLMNTKTLGKSTVIKLNTKHPTIKSYLSISSNNQKEEFLNNQPIIKKINSELDSKDIILLFGSFAKQQERIDSDIDFLIINNDGKQTCSFSKYEFLFKRKINPIYITKSEFNQMLSDKDENVGKQALKDHIILNNPEAFWEMAVGDFQ